MFDPKNVDLLLVDDDNDFREVAAKRFSRSGYRVQEAADGEQAARLCERRQFHVAVLDLRLPGMSGLELMEKLRESNPEAEMIMLTGEGTIELAVQAMKRGALRSLFTTFTTQYDIWVSIWLHRFVGQGLACLHSPATTC